MVGADVDRGAYVRLQQELAAKLLASDELQAACKALRTLRSVDFVRRDLAEAHLGVLRDLRAEPDERRIAARKLIDLVPSSAMNANASVGVGSIRARN